MIDIFGHMPTGDPVHRIQLENERLKVRLITFGAAIQSIEAPDGENRLSNVVLGLNDLAGYVERSPHFGAIPGRFAGRIDHGRFILDGVTYQLSTNNAPNTLHGGFVGFGRRNWTLSAADTTTARFTLTSWDGDEGFPGTVQTSATYSLSGAALTIRLEAESDRPTIINLTNHSYFNLAGEGSGTALQHELEMAADYFLPIDTNAIPTGELLDVSDTPFDFRTPQVIGNRIRQNNWQLLRAQGYDHSFIIRGSGMRNAASLCDPLSGRTLTVHTDQPAIQLYTGNTLDARLSGISHRIYRSGDAVCLEAQHAQDSPNRPGFPLTTLQPSSPFQATIVFEFGVRPASMM